jgi:ABC-type transport system involved in cytochrome c biogenesis ATPase subunit
MKSAYELAMERLSKQTPTVVLSAEQKKQIAELESLYASKIAEREIFLDDERAKAIDKGDAEALEQIEKQMVSTRKSLQAELEEKKALVRQGKA